MKRMKAKVIPTVFAICAVILFSGMIRVPAADIHDDSLSDKTASKEKLQSQIDIQQQKAQESENNADEFKAQIIAINMELTELAIQMDQAHTELSDLQEAIDKNQKSLENIDQEKEQTKTFLYSYIKMTYESRVKMQPISIFLHASSLSDFWNRQYYQKTILAYFNEKLYQYADLNALLQTRQNELLSLQEQAEEKEQSLLETREHFHTEIKKLSALFQESEAAAKDANKKASILASQLAAMEAAERTMQEAEKAGYTSIIGGTKTEPQTVSEITIGNGTDYYYVSPYPYTNDELTLLAGIIQAEAGSSHYPGMLAVGSVVMNRVENERFPDTIAGVIYAPHQFAPAGSGRLAVILAKGPDASNIQVAQDVLNGKRNIDCLYFKADWYAREHGISGVNIGGNVFH